jgi:hypothetical protein
VGIVFASIAAAATTLTMAAVGLPLLVPMILYVR